MQILELLQECQIQGDTISLLKCQVAALNSILSSTDRGTLHPFEPIRKVSMYFLSIKVSLLIAIATFQNVLELGVLSFQEQYCTFHNDIVVL